MGKLISRVADFFREADKLFLILCAFASSYGCLAIYSSTRHLSSARPAFVQILSMCIGIIAAIVISTFDFERFIKYWYLAAIAGVGLVVLTFFVGFAPEGTDDKAWLDLGITTFQPSELMKISFIISFSAHVCAIKGNINKPKFLLPLCLHGAFPVLLINFQGDDGTALVFAFMFLCMLWAAGVSWKYFVAAFVAIIIASPLIYFFVMDDQQRTRTFSFLDIESDIQGSTYQQYRGRMALANGGFSGQGLFKGSLTQIGGVPEGQNDFIFVSIGEELGFLGCMAVLFVLGAICLRAVNVARKCQKKGGKIICVGFFGMIFAQIIINIGMCVALLPVIGVTLPFFSAGGTSLVCVYLGVGLVMSVYMHRNTRTLYLRDK